MPIKGRPEEHSSSIQRGRGRKGHPSGRRDIAILPLRRNKHETAYRKYIRCSNQQGHVDVGSILGSR
eukprot:4299231-Pyramimonas_sp.AAC.1